jgi:hypothetical protein
MVHGRRFHLGGSVFTHDQVDEFPTERRIQRTGRGPSRFFGRGSDGYSPFVLRIESGKDGPYRLA